MTKTKGVFLIAKNNKHTDYVKQAVHLAKRIKKYLGVPVAVATDSPEYLKGAFDLENIEHVIPLEYTEGKNGRVYFDGSMSQKEDVFKNAGRASVYELSPFDETLLMDTDFIICNDRLKNVFDSPYDFMIYKDSEDIAKVRDEREFEKISDTSIDFYWATVVFFRKTEENKTFFDLVKHIESEWNHYRRIYRLDSPMFRNDFVFSIAIHMINGFSRGDFAKKLPGKMIYSTDKDILWKMNDDELMLLVQKKKYLGEYTPIRTKGMNIHVMNKFSLGRMIDEENANG
jgi:hypothetical protein